MDIIIFGISGDLAAKKLVPSLVRLFNDGKLPEDTRLIGFSRSDVHHETPFPYLHVKGSYDNVMALEKHLRKDKKQLFYLALPPEASKEALRSISDAGMVTMADEKRMRTILVEKPFGNGYEDAKSLIHFIGETFRADQCLKVDHYAGKPELRDLDELHDSGVAKVTFEILETSTVENRRGFYDTVGALRDTGQNHLLLMAASYFGGTLREGGREEALRTIHPGDDVAAYRFGRYEGYDAIETYFSIPAIHTEHDCEIILRSGKGLSTNSAKVTIENADGSVKTISLSSGTKAYENILMDAIEGRHESFLSDEEVLLSWSFIEKVELVKRLMREDKGFFTYSVGSDANSFL